MVTGLSVVYFYVRDLEGAVAFFRDRLGIPLEQHDASWAEANLRETRFALHAWHEGAPEPGSGGVSVSFRVDDVEAAAAELRAAGVEVGEVHHMEYGSHCELKAPEGYVVSLFAPAR